MAGQDKGSYSKGEPRDRDGDGFQNIINQNDVLKNEFMHFVKHEGGFDEMDIRVDIRQAGPLRREVIHRLL